MRKLSKEGLADILRKHEMWLNGEEGGERADFSGANLEGADLEYAILEGANLEGANLSYANLEYAILEGADLEDTDLEYANLLGAYLSDKEKYRLGTILKAPITGYKKCWNRRYSDSVIVTLEIPKGAIVFCINGKKCRTNMAKVVAISEGDIAFSSHSKVFQYKVGQEIEIDDFNLMYNIECGTGIHFFKTIEEAENYEL